jgi:hypothetical protein
MSATTPNEEGESNQGDIWTRNYVNPEYVVVLSPPYESVIQVKKFRNESRDIGWSHSLTFRHIKAFAAALAYSDQPIEGDHSPVTPRSPRSPPVHLADKVPTWRYGPDNGSLASGSGSGGSGQSQGQSIGRIEKLAATSDFAVGLAARTYHLLSSQTSADVLADTSTCIQVSSPSRPRMPSLPAERSTLTVRRRRVASNQGLTYHLIRWPLLVSILMP